MTDLARLGIRIEAHGDRLRYSPRLAVTPDLVERMKAHKGELLAILRPESEESEPKCCWCGSTQLIDGQLGRIWCDACERVAWLELPNKIVRADVLDLNLIAPPAPCPDCGGLELWETVAGDLFGRTPGKWRCLICDPPAKSRRLLQQRGSVVGTQAIINDRQGC